MISKDTLHFLTKLKAHNTRDWFHGNKPEFKRIEAEVRQSYNRLFELLKGHDDVDKLKLFRIYRDVRFSKNKQPYKTHFGGAFHRKKPYLRGGYYMHIQPQNESFIALGFWEPNSEDLLRIRKEFEIDATEMRKILTNKKFNSNWGDAVAGDEVKTAPKGFSKEHKSIDLIKKKQYLFIKKFTDDEVVAPNFIEDVNQTFKTGRPFLDYMSEVLTTDLNGVSII